MRIVFLEFHLYEWVITPRYFNDNGCYHSYAFLFLTLKISIKQ